MQRVSISKISDFTDQEVTVKGWLYNIRSSGKLMFPEIRDGSGIIQGVVVKNAVSEKVWEDFSKLTQESSLKVKGTVTRHPKKEGVYELQINDIEIIHIADPYPITPKEHGVEFLMDRRHLWIRSPRQVSILRVRNEIIQAIRDYMYENGFILFDTPIFTPNACEGTSTLFATDYFDIGKAYLSQSGQLYAEAGAMALGKVYTLGPTFRAENSMTRRHLTEFWMMEPEMAFYDIDDDMDLIEDFLENVVQRVLKNCRKELEILGRDISKLENVKKPFPRITYDEAVDILIKKDIPLIRKTSNGEEQIRPFPWGEDFGAPHEEAIVEDYDKPVMVHRWPAEAKSFYMKRDPANPKIALGVDVLAPEGFGEIIGGSQREDNFEELEKRIIEHKLPLEEFQWFLDLRRYGSVPHSGFGLGIERMVNWICNLENIREAIPFARRPNRITP
ncbi:MAG: asparagine--tRNA ligase [Ignavibacteria bacterium]|nr:asparagine--tRNA ligase [Ignavibacteria bacterium]MBK9403577.1 asparagine--tRNA ligase [Ignavibacteria bacterium]MBL0107132.1 asparagine--tRNA ligase [Ignavibacteria bacterium]